MRGIEAGNKVKIKDLEQIDRSISSHVMEQAAREYEYQIHGKGGLSPPPGSHNTHHRVGNIILHNKKTDDWAVGIGIQFEPVALRPPLLTNPDYEIYKSDDENMILISDESKRQVFWINKEGLEPVLSGYGGGIKKKRKYKRKKSKRKKSKH